MYPAGQSPGDEGVEGLTGEAPERGRWGERRGGEGRGEGTRDCR